MSECKTEILEQLKPCELSSRTYLLQVQRTTATAIATGSTGKENGNYQLTAVTQGEKLNPQCHQQRVDIKAVTLHRFQLAETNKGWAAMTILDI